MLLTSVCNSYNYTSQLMDLKGLTCFCYDSKTNCILFYAFSYNVRISRCNFLFCICYIYKNQQGLPVFVIV